MAIWGWTQHVCATCSWWSGNRSCEFTASFYDAEGKGKCRCRHGRHDGEMVDQNASCTNWRSMLMVQTPVLDPNSWEIDDFPSVAKTIT